MSRGDNRNSMRTLFHRIKCPGGHICLGKSVRGGGGGGGGGGGDSIYYDTGTVLMST